MSISPTPWTLKVSEDVLSIIDASGFLLMSDEPYYPTAPTERDDFVAIAALPDLVEALQQMIACHGEKTCPAIDAARAALEKAGIPHERC